MKVKHKTAKEHSLLIWHFLCPVNSTPRWRALLGSEKVFIHIWEIVHTAVYCPKVTAQARESCKITKVPGPSKQLKVAFVHQSVVIECKKWTVNGNSFNYSKDQNFSFSSFIMLKQVNNSIFKICKCSILLFHFMHLSLWAFTFNFQIHTSMERCSPRISMTNITLYLHKITGHKSLPSHYWLILVQCHLNHL